MSDEEVNQNVSDEVGGVVENMLSALRNMEGTPKLCRSAISCIYYAVFHSEKALLSGCGVDARSHEDVHRQFSLHFGKSGIFPKHAAKAISDLMSDRQNADYKLFIPLDESDVAEAARKGFDHLQRFEEVMKDNGFGNILDQHNFGTVLKRFCGLTDGNACASPGSP